MRALELERRKATGCLDPLTKSLETFQDEEDLVAKINALYAKLDEDGSGGLCYEELREGLKMSLGLPIALTREDFETITENGRFVTDSEFDSEQFQQMMRAELHSTKHRVPPSHIFSEMSELTFHHFISSAL